MADKPSSNWRSMARAFVRSPTGIPAALFVAALLVLAVIGTHVFGRSAATVHLTQVAERPSSQSWLGTDELGRNTLLRTLAATRTSLLLPALAVAIAVVLGGLIGGLTAAGGRNVRRLGVVVIDVSLSFGYLLLALFIIAVTGAGATGAVIAIGVSFTPTFARFFFSLVTSIVAQEYMKAAQVVGVGPRRLMTSYVSRNMADSVVIMVFVSLGEAIMSMAALSFLGLGVQSPTYDWGQMLTEGINLFYLNPYAALAPAAIIVVTGVAVALLGDAVARAVNPTLWRVGAGGRPPLVGLREQLLVNSEKSMIGD